MKIIRSWWLDVVPGWRDTRGKVAVTLIILWMGALLTRFSLTEMMYPAVAVVISVVADIILTKVRFQKDVFSLSSVVTGLLIGLILDPRGGSIPLVGACLAASVTKQYLGRGPHRHMFNPAAVGLVASSLFFGGTISWWGATWGYVPMAILVVGMVLALRQLHRLWIPALFLLIYFLSLLPYSTPIASFRLTIDGTVFLFAFIMITEPMTSLLFGKWRYGWGVFVGLLIFAENFIHFPLTDSLLVPLLAANAVGFFLVRPRFLSGSA